jgi:hypothetical protein
LLARRRLNDVDDDVDDDDDDDESSLAIEAGRFFSRSALAIDAERGHVMIGVVGGEGEGVSS